MNPGVIDQSTALWTREPERAKVQALYRAWVERCPVYLALTKPLSVKTTVTKSA